MKIISKREEEKILLRLVNLIMDSTKKGTVTYTQSQFDHIVRVVASGDHAIKQLDELVFKGKIIIKE